MSEVRVEQLVAAEPDTAFEWFTDPTLIVRWWPTQAAIEVVAGGRYVLHWDGPDVTLRGEYRVAKPGERLVFTWNWDHDDLPSRVVDITFKTADGGTLIAVVHEAETEAEGADYVDGWTHFLGQLAAALDPA